MCWLLLHSSFFVRMNVSKASSQGCLSGKGDKLLTAEKLAEAGFRGTPRLPASTLGLGDVPVH